MDCRSCKTELTHDKKRGCLVCLKCHPPEKGQPIPPQEKRKYIDVTMTEERVRDIVRDELENWHIQKPPVTKKETESLTLEKLKKVRDSLPSPPNVLEIPVNSDWRAKAKELGIPLFQRTKADVLAEIGTRTDSKFNK